MGYRLSWIETNRVVLIEVEGDVDTTLLRELAEELNKYLTSGNKPVHIITDARNMAEFPKSVSEVRAALKSMAPFGIDIIIGFENPIARFIASVISHISRFEVRVVKDMDEAVNALQRLDPTVHISVPFGEGYNNPPTAR